MHRSMFSTLWIWSWMYIQCLAQQWWRITVCSRGWVLTHTSRKWSWGGWSLNRVCRDRQWKRNAINDSTNKVGYPLIKKEYAAIREHSHDHDATAAELDSVTLDWAWLYTHLWDVVGYFRVIQSYHSKTSYSSSFHLLAINFFTSFNNP